MIGEIVSDGKTLWINSDKECILRITCMDIIKNDMNPIPVNIHKTGELLNIMKVK